MKSTDSISDASSLASKIPTVSVAENLECDYETNCTPLYKAIENAIVNDNEDEDYDNIAHFLDFGEWPANCAYSKTSRTAGSAQEQAKTWVTRFKETDSSSSSKGSLSRRKIEWSQLPLHLAIVGGAPSNIIGGLVKLYPMGLRCTDDQQMLPLHLALRHGAEDEIVAYLLMQFPEAVNAKGKHGRTPVDCALRARDKVRGIIVETFVEKTKSSLISGFHREKAVLQGSLDVARQQWDETSGKLQIKEASLAALEEQHLQTVKELEASQAVASTSHASTVAQLEELKKDKKEMEKTLREKIEKLEKEKLTESIEYQKTIDSLQSEKHEVEAQLVLLMKEEGDIRQELAMVKNQISCAVTTDDFNKLKEETGMMETYRMSRTKSQAFEGIKELLHEVKESQSKDPEMKSIKKTLKELERTESSLQSTEEVEALKNEVDKLRSELKERNEASRTKLEVAILKKSLEAELRNTDYKTKEQMATLRRAIDQASPLAVESKMGAELAALKSQMESLRLELKENELAFKTKQDLEDLEVELDTAVANAQDEYVKKDYLAMKHTAERLGTTLRAPRTSDDVLSVSKQVAVLKESLHKKQAAAKIKVEADELLGVVDKIIKRSDGMTQQLELIDLKRTISKLAGPGVPLADKEVDELVQIRHDLNTVRKNVKDIKDATKTHNELKTLKQDVDRELKHCADKTQKEVAEVSDAIDAVDLDAKQSKILKDTLTAAILNSHKKVQAELLQIKEAASAIKPSKIDSKDKFLWESIREDIAKLKVELKHRSEGKLDEELLVVKAALEQINADHEKKRSKKITELRNEIQEMNEVTETREAPKLTPDSVEPKLTSPPQMKQKASANPPAALLSEKRKSGIRKFLSRRFSRKASSKKNDAKSTSEEEKVPTILPPSGVTTERSGTAMGGGISSGEEDLPPGVKSALSKRKEEDSGRAENAEMEVTLELHRSMSKTSPKAAKDHSDDDDDDDYYYPVKQGKNVRVNSDVVNSMPTFPKSRLSKKNGSSLKSPPSALRKVKSMDLRRQPSSGRTVQIDPYDIVRTWSRSVIRAAQSQDNES